MKKSTVGHFCVLFLSACLSTTAMAQQGGDTGGGTTGGTTGGTNTGGTTTGTGTNTGQVTAGLDAETAFAGIERGETVGSTAGTGQGFGIGATANPGTRAVGGGGGFGGLGGLGGFGGLNSLFGGGLGGGGQASQPAIRTRLRSAIKVDPIPPQRVQLSATSRLQSLPSSSGISGVNVTMEGRTAIVTGVVTSDHDRRISELLMRLEPGVTRVDNRLMISP